MGDEHEHEHEWTDSPYGTDYRLCQSCGWSESVSSPARDDAEKAIAAVLNLHDVERLNMSSVDCTCGWTFEPTPKPGHFALIRAHTAHVASVIAAHMGAPDELTALRVRIRALADRWEARAPEMHDDARDILLNHAAAIRTAIEPEFVPLPEPHVCDDHCQTCRELGDA